MWECVLVAGKILQENMNSANSDGVCEQTGAEGEKEVLLLPHQKRVITRSVRGPCKRPGRAQGPGHSLLQLQPQPPALLRGRRRRRSNFQEGGQPSLSAAAGSVKAACALTQHRAPVAPGGSAGSRFSKPLVTQHCPVTGPGGRSQPNFLESSEA